MKKGSAVLLVIASVVACRPGPPPVAPVAPAIPVATSTPRIASGEGEWCQLAPRSFDDQWRSPRSAGPFAIALTGPMTRPRGKSEVHVIDRARWTLLEVELDIGFVAGKGDELWFGGRGADGERFRVHHAKSGTWEPRAAAGMAVDGDATWAGDALLVWNGLSGARYVVAKDRWDPMSAEGSAKQRLGGRSFSVWNGSELVTSTQTNLDRAKMVTEAWDPARDRWRPIETPFHSRFTGAVADAEGNAYTVAGVIQPQGWQTQSLFRLRPYGGAWEEAMPLPGSACDFMATGIGYHGGKLFVFSDEGKACVREVATGATYAVRGLGLDGAEYMWIGDAMVAVRKLWEKPVETTGDRYRAPKPLSMTAFLYHAPGTAWSPACSLPADAERTHLGRTTPCPDGVRVRVTSGAGDDCSP